MAVAGYIFDIKRFAVHDGPGIRTTLFFKGCSLRCHWCHNPESFLREPQLAYYAHKCVNCGECVSVCHVNAHEMKDAEHIFHRDKCIACGRCESVCLGRALKFYGSKITVDEAVEAVLEDKTFYEPSGGCTVSGGEPLLQAEFCASTFKELKKQQIHCAIDTSGAVAWENIQTVLPYTDMFLYDLKHVDETLHVQQVGCSNRLILVNLQRLSKCGVPIEIRIPTVPRFNADEKSMNAIGKFLSGLDNITGVRLLPYHFAHSKYECIGLPDTMTKVETPTQQQMVDYAEQLRGVGLNAKL